MENRNFTTSDNNRSTDIFYPPNGFLQEPEADDIVTMDELTRSNRELEQFAFIAAHDLQNPLSVVASYAQLFDKKYRGKLDDNADDIISSILESAERMQKLIQSLLRYSRAGNGDVEFKKLDYNLLLNRALENLKVNIVDTFAQIRHEGFAVITGDEIQLTAVFQNLINNAIKFRKKEEVPSIYVSVKEKDGQWLFSVQDNGIGIEAKYLQSIFGLFKRLHGQEEYAGNGIGLSLCKRIIESHRGRIWAESEIGKGTKIYFTIPKV